MAKTTRPETPNSNHFAGLCQSLALSTPEVIEFAGLCEKLTILDDGDALAVLDCESGKLLEHCQLLLIWGSITILEDSEWSRGLILWVQLVNC